MFQPQTIYGRMPFINRNGSDPRVESHMGVVLETRYSWDFMALDCWVVVLSDPKIRLISCTASIGLGPTRWIVLTVLSPRKWIKAVAITKHLGHSEAQEGPRLRTTQTKNKGPHLGWWGGKGKRKSTMTLKYSARYLKTLSTEAILLIRAL
ncbi:hypothetical protein AUP68_10893 [Ilyonectria robusta]